MRSSQIFDGLAALGLSISKSEGTGGGSPTSVPLLKVEGLRVAFNTEDGLLQAVDGVSFDLRAGEVLAIVGESGSGKSVTAQTIIGLTRSPNARIEGSVSLEARNCLRRARRDLQKVRGERIAMIFQDPMTSLNPVYRVGRQIVEAIRAHAAGRRGRGAARGRSSCSTRSASPTPSAASTTTRMSSPAGCGSGR